MKPSKLCLLPTLLCGVLMVPASQANTANHGVYAKAGFFGVGAGYAHSVFENLTVRSDFTTVGTIERNDSAGRLDYKASLKANQLGFYGDLFPFGGAFRLTGGVLVRKLQMSAEGRPNAAGSIAIHKMKVADYGPDDWLSGQVKFPSVAPYLGIGWGHESTLKSGLDFVFDLGVALGKPKTTLTISDSLRDKLETVAGLFGSSAAEQVEGQRRELADTVDRMKFFPQLYVGLSYHFKM